MQITTVLNAFIALKNKMTVLEERLRGMRQHHTNSQFELLEEIAKLAAEVRQNARPNNTDSTLDSLSRLSFSPSSVLTSKSDRTVPAHAVPIPACAMPESNNDEVNEN